MIRVSIVGLTGYTGIELLRYLTAHPAVEIEYLVSSSNHGKKLTDLYPQFSGRLERQLVANIPAQIALSSDLVFSALPHGISQQIVAEYREKGVRVIDLSGDYRYADISIYQRWYQRKHSYPHYAAQAVYGLAELNRDRIKDAGLVANPGCYPTASLLGLLPLLTKGWLEDETLIIDAKSGVSGAGKSARQDLIFCELNENIRPYSVFTHRHTSEIQYILDQFFPAGVTTELVFTPHLIPMKRGILVTLYLRLKAKVNQNEVVKLYKGFYRGSDFIKVLEGKLPETKYVYGSNDCQLGIRVDPESGMTIIFAAIDNLGKGACGQAVQNMNIMFDLPEQTGLTGTAIVP